MISCLLHLWRLCHVQPSVQYGHPAAVCQSLLSLPYIPSKLDWSFIITAIILYIVRTVKQYDRQQQYGIALKKKLIALHFYFFFFYLQLNVFTVLTTSTSQYDEFDGVSVRHICIQLIIQQQPITPKYTMRVSPLLYEISPLQKKKKASNPS